MGGCIDGVTYVGHARMHHHGIFNHGHNQGFNNGLGGFNNGLGGFDNGLGGFDNGLMGNGLRNHGEVMQFGGHHGWHY